MSDTAVVVRRLDENPLARLMFGHRELFHSNLLAWFFDVLPGPADAVFGEFSHDAPGAGSERSARREERHLDLVLRWPGRAPVVVENKTFSVPLQGQLDEYLRVVSGWDPAPGLVLLAVSTPSFDPAPWTHLSYAALAERIRDALPASGTYEVQTMVKWCELADDLQHLVAMVALADEGEDVWRLPPLQEHAVEPQLRTALAKTRAQTVAVALAAALPDAGRHVWSALTHGMPLVEILEPGTVDGVSVDLGWQLQDNQFRRVVRFHGRGRGDRDEATRLRHEQFCAERPELFSFRFLPDAVPGGRKQFGHFGSHFVYQYVKVPHLTIAELIAAARAVHAEVAHLLK